MCILQEWSFFFTQTCGVRALKICKSSTINALGLSCLISDLQTALEDYFMWEHICVAYTGLIFFGARFFYDIDVCHLFTQSMLAIISFVEGVTYCADPSLLWVLSRASSFTMWLSLPCQRWVLLPSCWSISLHNSFFVFLICSDR